MTEVLHSETIYIQYDPTSMHIMAAKFEKIWQAYEYQGPPTWRPENMIKISGQTATRLKVL